MQIAAPNEKGAFVFTYENSKDHTIFVKSEALVTGINDCHCSAHINYMNGCDDCLAVSFIKTFDKQAFEKLPYREVKKLRKGASLSPLEIQISKPSPKIQLVRQQLARAVAVFFAKEKRKAAKAATEKYKEVKKATSQEKDIVIAYAAWNAIEWELLVNAVETDLLAAAQVGAEEGMSQLGSSDSGLWEEINTDVRKYAHDRAAEMVGKHYVGNELVDNPAAKFVIAETTKDDLEDIVKISLDQEETLEEMYDRIIAAATFSDLRSQLISKNEANLAQVRGHLTSWRLSKSVSKVGIRLSDAHVDIDECDDLAASTYSIDNVPTIPAHPNCQCEIYAVELVNNTY